MKYAEYSTQRVSLIEAYLNLAVVQRLDGGQCADAAQKLAKSLDQLALELDPFSEEAPALPPLTVREACRRRTPIDGSDAQAMEGALSLTERERDDARAEVKRLKFALDATLKTLRETP